MASHHLLFTMYRRLPGLQSEIGRAYNEQLCHQTLDNSYTRRKTVMTCTRSKNLQILVVAILLVTVCLVPASSGEHHEDEKQIAISESALCLEVKDRQQESGEPFRATDNFRNREDFSFPRWDRGENVPCSAS